jgi:LuxR family transcriptional regulator, maltose regulon positive regulatory protein
MAETFEDLTPGPGCRLLLVQAPAGSKRIEALRRWGAGRSPPVAWVTLEPPDDEPARFLCKVREALRAATGRSLDGSGTDGIELLNALTALEIDGLVIVLENFEAIRAADVQAIVQVMLDYPPPGLLLVLLTEATPPLELARLRVRRQMVEMR